MSDETIESTPPKVLGSNSIETIPAINSNNPSPSNHKDFTIIWKDLSYEINLKRWYHCCRFSCTESNGKNSDAIYRKVIFQRVSGEAKSRQLTAIMGPSGAGKSSLLHCLFQGRRRGTSGQILVDSKSRNKLKVCFIPQHDYLNEYLTVREDLLFVSKLQLARNFNVARCNSQEGASYIRQIGDQYQASLTDHEASVVHVAGSLGLSSCLDTPIKRISGGEKKRLSIARELLSKPDVLVLDEPTTGLDSLSCYKTIVVLRDLVRRSVDPILVVVTIHQPEKAVFNLFDKAYLLSRGDGVVFDDNPTNAILTIENVIKTKMPSENYNPASFLIELASEESHEGSRALLSQFQRDKFNQQYSEFRLSTIARNNKLKYSAPTRNVEPQSSESSSYQHNASSEDDQISNNSASLKSNDSISIQLHPMDHSLYLKKSRQPTYHISHQLRHSMTSQSVDLIKSFRDTMILTRRSWLSIIRNPSYTRSRLAFHILLPLGMLVVFGSGIGTKDNCPKIDAEFNIDQMKKNIEDGTVTQNFDDYRSVGENIAFFFILTYGLSINIISTASAFYPLTLNMFRKETGNGLYSAGPYYIGQQLAELPLEFFFSTFTSILTYKLSGQKSSYLEWRMLVISYLIFIVCYFSQTLGLIAGLIFNTNITAAVIVGQMSLIPSTIASGYIVSLPRMKSWLKHFSFISIFRHYVVGFVAARYGFNVCDCDESTLDQSSESFMTPNLRNTLDYLFPPDNSTLGEGILVTDLFDDLHKQFTKAQTFGAEIHSCKDLKPHIMHALGIYDEDLFISLAFSILATIFLRLLVLSLLISSQYKKN